MKRTILMILGLLFLVNAGYSSEMVSCDLDRDARGNVIRNFPSPMGKPAFLISGESNTFKTNATANKLVIKVSVDLITVQNTITLNTNVSVALAKKAIDDSGIPFLNTAIIRDAQGNKFLALIVYGNTASIQVIATTLGAETACGFVTSIVYATPPNFAPTVGGNPVSSSNLFPVDVDTGIIQISKVDTGTIDVPLVTEVSNVSSVDLLDSGTVQITNIETGKIDIGLVDKVTEIETGHLETIHTVSTVSSVIAVQNVDNITSLDSGLIEIVAPLPAGTNKIGALSDTQFAIPDGVDVNNFPAGFEATFTDSAVNIPEGVTITNLPAIQEVSFSDSAVNIPEGVDVNNFPNFTFSNDGLDITDHMNAHIHNGTMFRVTDYVSSFASAETCAYLLLPCTTDSHTIFYRLLSDQKIMIEFYEDSDTDSNGTELSVRNFNRNFPDNICMRVFRKAILSDTGTLLKTDFILADKNYSGFAESLEWVLNSSKKYVIMLTGTASSIYLFELIFHN